MMAFSTACCSPASFGPAFPPWPAFACRVEQSCHITWQAGCPFPPPEGPLSPCSAPPTPNLPPPAPETPLDLTRKEEKALTMVRGAADSPTGHKTSVTPSTSPHLWRPFDTTTNCATASTSVVMDIVPAVPPLPSPHALPPHPHHPHPHHHHPHHHLQQHQQQVSLLRNQLVPKVRFSSLSGLRRAGGKQPVTHCHPCKRYFSSLRDLNKHFQAQHMNALVREFQVAKSWKSLAAEEMSFEELEKTVEDGTGFQCPHCTFFAKWPTELQKHIMVHSKERPHQCVVCGLTYKWKWDLGRHFEKSHEGMPNPYKKINRIITKLLNQWGDKANINRAIVRKEFGL